MASRLSFSASALVVLAAGAVSLAACSDDDGSADVTAFCAVAPDFTEEVPASYVGSAEHVQDLREMRAEAPAELGDDLDRFIEHIDEHVDPADPDSQLIWNYPDEVNDTIGRVTAYIEQNCQD